MNSRSAAGSTFTFAHFAWRAGFALLLVMLTYNPAKISYFHWLQGAVAGDGLGPEHAVVGLLLMGMWAVYIRATLHSLGPFGLVLCTALLAAIVWWFADIGLLDVDSFSAMSWIILFSIALFLSIGMSWSHIRRRLSGQVDVDRVDS